MKILAVADIHGAQYRLNIVLNNIEKYSPDILVVCGDITQFGPRDVAKNFLDQIPIETLAVTGNIDSTDVDIAIDESKAINLNNKRVDLKGISFVGINGVDPNETLLFIKNNKNIVNSKTILVTHVPPFGFQDKVFIGMHGGSKELRKIIDKYRPRLLLCGHIHEDPGYLKNDGTIVVNCSMGKRGEGALIEINKDIKVEMLDE